jgi:hypothetical protein
MYLNTWPIGSGTIRRCCLIGISVTLLKDVCHCWGGLQGVTYVQAILSVVHSLSLLPSDQNVELSAPSPAPCLPGCCHASHHDDNGLNLWNQPQPIKCVLFKSWQWSWCLFTAMTLLRQYLCYKYFLNHNISEKHTPHFYIWTKKERKDRIQKIWVYKALKQG